MKELPDGRRIISTHGPTSGADGYLSPAEFYEKDRNAMDAVQKVLGAGSTADAEFSRCLHQWRSRLADTGALDIEWTMRLVIVSDGNTGRIVEATVKDEHWPPGFDAQAKACYLTAASGVPFPATRRFTYRVAYPMRVSGPGR